MPAISLAFFLACKFVSKSSNGTISEKHETVKFNYIIKK